MAFGGVAYAELRHDRRERRSKDRQDTRDTLRELRAAILELEDAGTDLLVAQSAKWNGQPMGQRVWPDDRTTAEWMRFARGLRQVTALRSELVDDALRERIEAYQAETAKLLRVGQLDPQTPT